MPELTHTANQIRPPTRRVQPERGTLLKTTASHDVLSVNNLIPIICVCIASVVFSIHDVALKLLSSTYPLHEMIAVRSSVALIVICVYLYWTTGSFQALKTRRPALHTVRALLMIATNTTLYISLAAMPIADAVAIFYSAPLIITFLSTILLREFVGPMRWLAVCLGLLGMLMIVKPSGADYTGAALIAVLSAFIYAFSQILTRNLGKTESTVTMSFYGQIGHNSFAVLIGLMIGSGRFYGGEGEILSFVLRPWSWPSVFDMLMFVGFGLISGVGGLLMTKAYRDGPPSLIASFEYVALLMAVVWGVIFWNEIPDIWTSLGIALILGAGIFVALREAKKGAPPPPRRRMSP